MCIRDSGNTFHCIAVAYLLAYWTVEVGYRSAVPTIKQLWKYAGYGEDQPECSEDERDPEVTEKLRKLTGDPGVHDSSLGDEERVTVVTPPPPEDFQGDRVMHLVQDEETVAEIHHCELPPDEYY